MVTKRRRKPAKSSKQKRSRGSRGTGGAGGSQVRKLALIGAGKLGEALLSGILSSQFVPQSRLFATAAHDPRVKFIREKYDVHSGTDNVEAVKGADLVLICLKPQQIRSFLHEVKAHLRKDVLLISVAASVTTGMIERGVGRSLRVVRAMPNTPCLIREGMTSICRGLHAREEDLKLAENIFDSMGRTAIVDEKHMDAITGLSASGPAYVYMIIESLAEAGVKLGLPRELATELSSQTLLGSSAMVLESKEHPAKLKDIVTTPAGCTIDGLLELEQGGLRVTLIKAVVRAAARAKQLVETQNS